MVYMIENNKLNGDSRMIEISGEKEMYGMTVDQLRATYIDGKDTFDILALVQRMVNNVANDSVNKAKLCNIINYLVQHCKEENRRAW